MSLITVDELKGFIPDSSESDATLEMRITENEAEITKRFGVLELDESEEAEPGTLVSVTETVRGPGLTLLRLHQEPASIVSITDSINTTEAELEEADYRIRGRHLERVIGRWGHRTVVEYVPLDARAQRRRVLVKLVQVDMNYAPGMGSQGAGGWNESYFGKSYLAEREEILSTLGEEQDLFA